MLGIPVELAEKSESLYDIDCGGFSYADELKIVKFDPESSSVVRQALGEQCKAKNEWVKLPLPKEIAAILHDGFSKSASHETNPDASELLDRILQSDHGWWRSEYTTGDGYQNVVRSPLDSHKIMHGRRIHIFDSDEGLFAFNWATD